MASPSWLMHLQARARGEVAGYFDPNTPMEERGAQPTPLAPTPTGELAHPDTIADSQAAGVDVVVLAPVREDTTPPAVPTTLAPDPRYDDLMAQVEQLLVEMREERATIPAGDQAAPDDASTGFVSPLEDAGQVPVAPPATTVDPGTVPPPASDATTVDPGSVDQGTVPPASPPPAQ